MILTKPIFGFIVVENVLIPFPFLHNGIIRILYCDAKPLTTRKTLCVYNNIYTSAVRNDEITRLRVIHACKFDCGDCAHVEAI